MTTSQAIRRVLAASLAMAAIAFVPCAGAGPSSDRSADEPTSGDRQTSVQEPRINDRVADPVQSTTESGNAQDLVIAERVRAALAVDPELKQVVLRVQAENGQVRLVGSVSTFEQKDRALQIASAVQGVSRVDDAITLRDRPLPTASG